MRDAIDFIENEELIAPEKMNIFQRIGNLLFSPKKLFVFLREKQSILFPLIIMSVLAIFYQILLWEPTRRTSMDLLYDTYKSMGINYTPDQLEAIITGQMVGTLIAMPVILIAAWAITTLIFYAVYRFANCEKGLKKYFSMMAYISIISTLGMIVSALFIRFTGGSLNVVVTSLSSLISLESAGYFLYGAASNIEIFNIWAFILYAIGFVYVGGVKKKTSYILAASLFVLSVLITGAFTSISNSLFGGLLGDFIG